MRSGIPFLCRNRVAFHPVCIPAWNHQDPYHHEVFTGDDWWWQNFAIIDNYNAITECDDDYYTGGATVLCEMNDGTVKENCTKNVLLQWPHDTRAPEGCGSGLAGPGCTGPKLMILLLQHTQTHKICNQYRPIIFKLCSFNFFDIVLHYLGFSHNFNVYLPSITFM